MPGGAWGLHTVQNVQAVGREVVSAQVVLGVHHDRRIRVDGAEVVLTGDWPGITLTQQRTAPSAHAHSTRAPGGCPLACTLLAGAVPARGRRSPRHPATGASGGGRTCWQARARVRRALCLVARRAGHPQRLAPPAHRHQPPRTEHPEYLKKKQMNFNKAGESSARGGQASLRRYGGPGHGRAG